MAKEPAIRSLTIQNLLSFGPEPTTVELRNLNVLIGANGSGKSNLIEVLGLLHNVPGDLARAISRGGPIKEWLWKGARKSTDPTAAIEVNVDSLSFYGGLPLRYRLALREYGYRLTVTDEMLTDGAQTFYRLRVGFQPEFAPNSPFNQPNRGLENFHTGASILSQIRDPWSYPELGRISGLFEEFRLYRNWEFGTGAEVRQPCDAGLPNEYLDEGFSNLGVVLNRLLDIPVVKDQILASLRTFYEDTKDLRTRIEGGRIQTVLEEKHLNATIPLIRLSDGTLRWLTLLTILLNPDPPPLVCIEEPDLGLHPDMIHELGKLLIDASTRMQLIITTHSDRLVEEFTETPEVVVVCEKENGASTFQRLEQEKLTAWLEEYTLGQIWTRGQIGGTRW